MAADLPPASEPMKRCNSYAQPPQGPPRALLCYYQFQESRCRDKAVPLVYARAHNRMASARRSRRRRSRSFWYICPHKAMNDPLRPMPSFPNILALPVERKVIPVFAAQDMRHQRRPDKAFGNGAALASRPEPPCHSRCRPDVGI